MPPDLSSNPLAQILATMPPSTDPGTYAQVLRQLEMSQAGASMALSPTGVQQPGGSNRGFYQSARVSPLSGLAKLAEAYISRKGMDTATNALGDMYASAPINTAVPGLPNSGGDHGSEQGLGGSGDSATDWAVRRVYYNDPQKYIDMMKGDPATWGKFMNAAGGNTTEAQAMAQIALLPEKVQTSVLAHGGGSAGLAEVRKQLLAEEEKARSETLRAGSTLHQFGPDAHPDAVTAMPGDNMQFSGQPGTAAFSAHPIPGVAPIQGESAYTKAAETAAGAPTVQPGKGGVPALFAPGRPPYPQGLRAPQSPPLPSPGQGRPGALSGPTTTPPAPSGGAPQASGAPPLPTVKPPAGGYLGPPPDTGANANASRFQTTAEHAAETAGGTTADVWRTTTRQDATQALELQRQIAEMRHLAASGAAPGPQNVLKMKLGTTMVAMGADPKAVSASLGVDIGALQAGQTRAMQLAGKQIGDKIDPQSFLQTNPNFAMVDGGFTRALDWMDKRAGDLIDKHAQFQQFHKNSKLEPGEEPDAFEAQWIKGQQAKIASGATNSAPPGSNAQSKFPRQFLNGQWWERRGPKIWAPLGPNAPAQ